MGGVIICLVIKTDQTKGNNMSIYQKVAETIANHPACSYVRLDTSNRDNIECINLRSGDLIQIGTKAQSRFKMSSVVSYALQNGNCPIESHERAVNLGHPTYFITNCGSVISSSKQEEVTIIIVEDGEIVRFEGKYFKVSPDFNNNMKLVEHKA
jgi:hypothetical protein